MIYQHEAKASQTSGQLIKFVFAKLNSILEKGKSGSSIAFVFCQDLVGDAFLLR